jgi:hypothetical protein
MMTEGRVRVESVEALKTLRTTLWKFAEACRSALSDAEGEMQRTLVWLETEQPVYWQGQIRKANERVARAKEAVRQKTVFKDATGARRSAVEEEKALALALRRLAEAEEKLAAVKKYARRLQKEISLYKGGVQRFTTGVEHDIPVAVSQLDRMVAAIEAYVALVPAAAGAPVGEALEAAGFRFTEAELAALRGPLSGQSLRQLTPSAEALAAAPRGAAAGGWTCGTLPAADVAALAAVSTAPQPVDAAQRIVVSLNARAARRLYLQRLVPASADDSGWYIGAAEGPAGELSAISAGELLGERPDFTRILPLPMGSVVALEDGRVAAVFNDVDRDVWPQAVADAAAEDERSSHGRA